MNEYLIRAACFLVLTFFATNNFAVVEINEFSTDQIRARYNALIEELRCPKCQNQNLAGSDSAVSVDLRKEALIMLENDHTDDEIRTFMRERYGDFILYNPPIEGKTLLVWVLPGVFLLFALIVAFFVIRSATRNAQLGQEDGYQDGEPVDEGFEGKDY